MEIKSWTEYYAEATTLPAIHDHLTNSLWFIEKIRQHCNGKRILEIGTGTGVVDIYLNQLGYEVTGIDLEPGIVEQNRRLNERFGATVNFSTGDMFNLSFEAGSFDACCHQGLLEHFDPPAIRQTLEQQVRIAERVVFSVPTVHWRGGVRGDERMWTGPYWLSLLEGFDVIEVFGVSHAGAVPRALAFAGRRLSANRPKPLFRWMALHRAGQIGFVLRRK